MRGTALLYYTTKDALTNMTQAPSPIRAYYRKMFKALVYQALVS